MSSIFQNNQIKVENQLQKMTKFLIVVPIIYNLYDLNF